MDFSLFLLVNATLFLRPGEVDPDLAGLPIYNVLILTNLFLASGAVTRLLDGRTIVDNPTIACVLAWVALMPLAHLLRGQFGLAIGAAFEGVRLVLYYLLLVGMISTPGRLVRFLFAVVAFTTALTGLALLQYHGVIEIRALEAVGDWEVDPTTGEDYLLLRLCSTGIFNDPNDLATILVVGIVIGLFFLNDRRSGLLRFAWLAPIGLFAYALTRTHSRGGFLSLLVALGALFVGRYGWLKALPLASLAIPAAVLGFGGRQASIAADGDSAQARLALWAEGFARLRESPLVGIGSNRYVEMAGQVAHNSFLQGYVESGVVGGTVFLGAFAQALLAFLGLRARESEIADAGLRRFRPYLLGIIAGYAAGLTTLSRNYAVPTYLILGLATAYLKMVDEAAPGIVPGSVARLDGRLLARMAAVGVAFLAASNLAVKFFLVGG